MYELPFVWSEYANKVRKVNKVNNKKKLLLKI